MDEQVDILELMQMMVAQVPTEPQRDLECLLYNQTKFAHIGYKGNSDVLVRRLFQVLQDNLSQASNPISLRVWQDAKNLNLGFLQDKHSIWMCSLKDCIFSEPLLTPWVATRLTLAIHSDDVCLVNRFQVLEEHLNFRVLTNGYGKTETCDVHLIDIRTHQEILYEQQPCIVLCPIATLVNTDAAHLDENILQKLNGNEIVSWPFFDSDLQQILQPFRSDPAICNRDSDPTLNVLSILVADDSFPSQVATRVMLEQLGCRVTCADDGARALALAHETKFDLLLLDERMPGLYGSEVATQLCLGNSPNKSTPKVALTGLTEPAEIEVLFNAGITHLLEKPVRKADLKAFLEHWQALRE